MRAVRAAVRVGGGSAGLRLAAELERCADGLRARAAAVARGLPDLVAERERGGDARGVDRGGAAGELVPPVAQARGVVAVGEGDVRYSGVDVCASSCTQNRDKCTCTFGGNRRMYMYIHTKISLIKNGFPG